MEKNLLDCSAVYLESYPIVQHICSVTEKRVYELVGNEMVLDVLRPSIFYLAWCFIVL